MSDSNTNLVKTFFNSLERSFADFFYYDRKEDGDFTIDNLKSLIQTRKVSEEEFVEFCRKQFREEL